MIRTAGEERLAVGAECDGSDIAFVCEGRSDRVAGRGVPESRGLVSAAGSEHFAIAAIGDGIDCALVPQGSANWLAAGNVPDSRHAIVSAGHDDLAIRAEYSGIDRTIMGKNCLESGVARFPGGEIGTGGVLPGWIIRLHCGTPGFDHPEQPWTDQLFLKRGPAAVEIATCQKRV
jgi:hypothetical protein